MFTMKVKKNYIVNRSKSDLYRCIAYSYFMYTLIYNNGCLKALYRECLITEVSQVTVLCSLRFQNATFSKMVDTLEWLFLDLAHPLLPLLPLLFLVIH